MNNPEPSATLFFILAAILAAGSFYWLRRLDPPKEPGESRFEGVLPNLRGAKIMVAYLGLMLGLMGMFWTGAVLFLL